MEQIEENPNGRTSAGDTICAISTPPGRGGIAVARVSGPSAIAISDSIWHGKSLRDAASHTAHLGTVIRPDGQALDQAVATVFRAPRSFTGEDVVEISVHGSSFIQQELLALLVNAGARMAEPGEFTRRAFINGRLDLAEAEAIADIIASSSRAAHRLAIAQLQGRFSAHIDSLRQQLLDLAVLLELELDFSEEDVTFADRSKLRNLADEIRRSVSRMASTFSSGQALRDGIPVAIIGRPNTGKSRLLNALLDTDRAIVSDIPGTTRDTVEDTTDINGHTFRFIDTAGIRDTDDPIESLGIDRAIRSAAKASIVIWLIAPDEVCADAVESDKIIITQAINPETRLIPALNKIDTLTRDNEQALIDLLQALTGIPPMAISTLTGQGIDNLRTSILSAATANLPADESLIVTNARHHAALTEAASALTDLIAGIDLGLTPDLLAQHLRQATTALATITGSITSTQILSTIFQRFCVGK